jgi:hypothetical protein
MEWVLVTAGIIGLIAAVWLLATRRGSPVEMPGGETLFGATTAARTALTTPAL